MTRRGQETFFTLQQKREHALEVGWQCEAEVAKGERCPDTNIEADHLVAWSHGGQTDLDNMIFLCLWHHAEKHRLDGDYKAYHTIMGRLKRRLLGN